MKSSLVRLLVPAVLIFGPGCPADDSTSGGSETGGASDPEPIDPFEGEGSNPPGDPDISLAWRSPSFLGNGLVHDSRYDLSAPEYTVDVSWAQLAAGVDWSSFVDDHAEKLRVGFRPSQIDADVTLAVGDSGEATLGVRDLSVYLSGDDANYRSETKTYLFTQPDAEQALAASGPSPAGGPRPTSIDTFAVDDDHFGINIVWTHDDSPFPWELVVGKPMAEFDGIVVALSEKGYRPLSVASRARAGASEYAGIFIQDGVPGQDWQLMLGLDAFALSEEASAAWQAGYYPFRGGYEQGSENLPLFNVLWIRRSPGLTLELRYNLDQALFEAEDQHWRGRGYHLESASAYSDAGVRRHAGLWVKHEPYLRWVEEFEIDPVDPTYVARYQPFHDQTIQMMTLAGIPKQGEYFRPSSTLHIYEGDQLVLNRAYTFAPAVYPDTPLDAPMGLASASKSITAAAVVREMNAQGLPLTTPFSQVAGINGVMAMESVPTVLDVLRMLGGFNETVASYSSHALIDASIYGEYPITGEMMYDYAVAGGHLDVAGDDSYWDLSNYNFLQQTQMLEYSNPGYTMLGELVRVQSGLSYEDYVRTNLLASLSLTQRIYPDPGHRRGHEVPTKAGLRSYLINEGHPYTITGPNPESPRLGSELVPKPQFKPDHSPRWRVNAGPQDAAAPATAAHERYAGRVYMGGAPLAAGGWYGDGKSLALLIRVLARFDVGMPNSVAAQLWDPQWWNPNHNKGAGWSYGLGWWMRGNWIAMAGGTDGCAVLVLHNLAYDFTVVSLTNLKGNPLGDLLGPLMATPNGVWGTSVLGGQFPCVDDPDTPQDECTGVAAAY